MLNLFSIFVSYNMFYCVARMRKKQEKVLDLRERLSELFECLTSEEQEQLEKRITLQTYKKNAALYHEGEHPNQLFCLLSGKVKVYKEGTGGRNQTMRLLKPVEYFGFRAYVAGEDFITAAAAIETSMIAKIPLAFLVDLIKKNNKLSWFFIQKLAKALGQADERTVNLTQKHIRARLAESLLFLRDSYGLEEDGSTLSIYMSREDLANLSNMTTSNAIRTLSTFANEKLVAIDGRKIKLINEDELQNISKQG